MISATIVTLNEEANIGECIASVRGICDDIVVVDSGSSDRTAEIAEALGARVFVEAFPGDGPQKNRAAGLAARDWILCLDADERATPELRDVIAALDLSRSSHNAYGIRRKTYVGSRWISRGGWYPDRVLRLYDRRKASFTETYLHARVMAAHAGELDADILHYSFGHIAQLVYGQRYATRDALLLYERGGRSGRIKPVLRGGWAFLRTLFLRGGFLQGLDGFTVALSAGLSSFMKYAILNEMHRDPAALARYRQQYGQLTGEKD